MFSNGQEVVRSLKKRAVLYLNDSNVVIAKIVRRTFKIPFRKIK